MDVGPVIYLARTFQTDIDTVVKFFIFVLIFVFDPMAVMFVISYNVALENRNEKKWPVYGEKKTENTLYDEDDDRMDIVGQNGNDGIHYDESEETEKNINRGGIKGR